MQDTLRLIQGDDESRDPDPGPSVSTAVSPFFGHSIDSELALRYQAPERCTSLSEVLVDLEAYLLDESGAQAKFLHMQEPADAIRDAEIAEQVRFKEAALAEERHRRKGVALAAAARHVEDGMETARSGWLSDEDSEPDFE